MNTFRRIDQVPPPNSNAAHVRTKATTPPRCEPISSLQKKPLSANTSGQFRPSQAPASSCERGDKQYRAYVGSWPTRETQRGRQNTDARRLATHLKPRKTPRHHHLWCAKGGAYVNSALVKPQSSKAASAERDRQETSISELSWAAPRSSSIASTRRPTQKAIRTRRATTPGQQQAASSARGGWRGVAWRVMTAP